MVSDTGFSDDDIEKRLILFCGRDYKMPAGQMPRLRLKLANLSEFVRDIKVTFDRYYNRRHNRRGYFWDDRLRVFALLAYVNCKVTKTGVSFTWKGAWEYDPVSGTGSVELRKDGRLSGRIKIKNGDESTFIAERAEEPEEPIPDPPSYRDKWRRRW
jgi:hypothetical protein